MVDLERHQQDSDGRWTFKNLVDLFGSMTSSGDPIFADLADVTRSVLSEWQHSLDGTFGNIGSAAVPIALRRIRLDAPRFVELTSTSGGQPSVLAFDPVDALGPDVYRCIDLRCGDKKDQRQPWALRVGIHVDAGDDLGLARLTAHQTAMRLAPVLATDLVKQHLESSGLVSAAEAIHSKAGLKSAKSDAALQDWQDRAGMERSPGRHPIFHHDWGRRLTASYQIDMAELTADDVQKMIDLLLSYLREAMTQEP